MAKSGQAFPKHGFEDGMTLRDWFVGMMILGAMTRVNTDMTEDAREFYQYADALIEAREREGK